MKMRRSSPIAGQWYAGTAQGLKDQISQCFLDEKFGPGILPTVTEHNSEGVLLGIISPHAGYAYSGPIAAHSYLELYRYMPEIDHVIVIGPNHRGLGSAISIFPEGTWEFPMGDLSIAGELVEYAQDYNFGKIQSKIEFDEYSHLQEHSVDIQFPFLQFLYGNDFSIMPICIGDQSLGTTQPLGAFLWDIRRAFSDKRIALVISTDLSHETNFTYLMKQDEKIREGILTGDPEKFYRSKLNHDVTMCGYGGVNALLALNQLEQGRIEQIAYANSGMITSNTSGYTVGYFAAKAVKS